MKRHFLVAVSCVLIGAGAVSAARPVAVGPRFPVSESPGARHLSSDVASGPLGQFVVTWQERAEPLGITRIAARRFDSGGNPVSGTFPVSDSAFSQHRPRVAVDASGNITIVWWSYERDGDGAGVFGQRFDRGGRRLGSEFQVNLTTAGTQYLGGIDAGDEGDFLVVWEDRRTSTGESHITVRRFEGSTGSFGPESVVGIGPAPFFWQSPDVALASDGGFQVVWTEYVIGSGGFEQLVWRRFDESAQPLGGEQAISIGDPSLYTSDVLPRIDIAPNDHSAVVWDRRLDRDTPVQVAGRRLDSSGPVSGDEIPSRSSSLSTPRRPTWPSRTTAASSPRGWSGICSPSGSTRTAPPMEGRSSSIPVTVCTRPTRHLRLPGCPPERRSSPGPGHPPTWRPARSSRDCTGTPARFPAWMDSKCATPPVER